MPDRVRLVWPRYISLQHESIETISKYIEVMNPFVLMGFEHTNEATGNAWNPILRVLKYIWYWTKALICTLCDAVKVLLYSRRKYSKGERGIQRETERQRDREAATGEGRRD